MSSFTSPLIISPLSDGRNFKLIEEFDYDVGSLGSGDTIHVPAEFVTDFASIPRILWSFLPYWGKYGKAAVIHDYLYQIHGNRTRKEADDIFHEAMLVGGTREGKAAIIWLAVRLFGFWAWRKFNA